MRRKHFRDCMYCFRELISNDFRMPFNRHLGRHSFLEFRVKTIYQ